MFGEQVNCEVPNDPAQCYTFMIQDDIIISARTLKSVILFCGDVVVSLNILTTIREVQRSDNIVTLAQVSI